MPKTPQAKRAAVKLNRKAWVQVCERLGLLTDSQRAKAFGVDRSTISQVQNGHREPSNGFIAGVMAYMAPHLVRFEDIFTGWETA